MRIKYSVEEVNEWLKDNLGYFLNVIEKYETKVIITKNIEKQLKPQIGIVYQYSVNEHGLPLHDVIHAIITLETDMAEGQGRKEMKEELLEKLK